MSRCHALLVLHLQIGTLVDEELAHLVATRLDGVVKRPLVLCVYNIKVGTQVNELLDCLDVTLANGIVDSCLAVLVLSVQVLAAQRDEVID